jgi:hypothetical protein
MRQIAMNNDETEKKKAPYKRLALNATKNVRKSFTKLIRERYAGKIDSSLFRDLSYGFNVLLSIDRLINEGEFNKRLELLEAMVRGESGTVIDSKSIDDPYAKNLKKKLDGETKLNAQLNNEILTLKRKLAENRAEPTDLVSVGDNVIPYAATL